MTPNTFNYMVAGYIVAFAVIGLYVLSLYLRWRALHQEMKILEDMREK